MQTVYTTLTFADLDADLQAIARDTRSVFGALDERQLNWRPDATRWSVAQCFDHLLAINGEMFRALDAAEDDRVPRTFWQRLPVLPRLFGRLMVKSMSPQATRKMAAPSAARPSSSAIDKSVIERFVAHQDAAAARIRASARRDPSRVVVSPFASFVTYSVLDACRLIVAHQRRHFEQARRVTEEPGFPRAPEAVSGA